MGVDIADLTEPEEIELADLTGRRLGVDALNVLYQFLSIIRQPDGTPLKDSEGRVTSHLSGLFYRTVKLLEYDAKPCYVFDGEPPEFKSTVQEERKERREEAREKWEEAKEEGELEEARKHAKQSSRVNEEILDSSRELLDAMGVPYIQAPSEGEAQAAYMVMEGDVWACSSQDYDALLFGAPRLVRNVAVTGKRKVPGKEAYVEVSPEIIELEDFLEQLEITREQLVIMGILMGTDYNSGGIKGIGPKRGLKRVREAGTLEEALEDLEWKWDPAPEELLDFFMDPPTTDDYSIEWQSPDADAIREMLVEKHDFSEKRVGNAIKKLENSKDIQGRLDQWG